MNLEKDDFKYGKAHEWLIRFFWTSIKEKVNADQKTDDSLSGCTFL